MTLKYNIGERVICCVDMSMGPNAISDAPKTSPKQEFEIIGKDSTGNEGFDYFLLCDEKIGIILEPEDYYGDDAFANDYSLPKSLLSSKQHIVGCYEQDIISKVNENFCFKCNSEIKERPLFISTYVGCLC